LERPSVPVTIAASPIPGRVLTAKIFISYRRGDSAGHSGWLYDKLSTRFGDENVSMDVLLPAGEDFVAWIQDRVGSSDALIAVIGPQWLRTSSSEGRGLQDPKDHVRLEIVGGLSKDVRVLPVLVGNATMPTEDELPDELKPLARRQAMRLSEERWNDDVRRLIERIENLTGEHRTVAEPAQQRAARRLPTAAIVAAAAVLAVGAVAAILALSGGDSGSGGSSSAVDGSSGSASGSGTGACDNLEIPADVRQQLSEAAGTDAPAKQGSVFYGACRGDTWALATFASSPRSGVFRREGDGWEYLGTIEEAECQIPTRMHSEWKRTASC
jgi:TIR domain